MMMLQVQSQMVQDQFSIMGWKVFLACVAFFALSTVTNAETRALLVGVSAYQHLSEAERLWAPRNDVMEMRHLLISRGVKGRNITILTDPDKASDRLSKAERKKLPTRQHIMDALDALTRVSKRGDFVVVYLSGHGSLQPHASDESHGGGGNGLDRVFLPNDVDISSPEGTATTIKNGIVDHEIRAFQAAIRDKGVDLWLTIDSCYSGSGLRAIGEARYKFVDPERLGVRIAQDFSQKGIVNFGDLDPRETRSGAIRRGRAAFLYASQADERAAELPLPRSVSRKQQTWRSAFTHAAVMALARQPKLSYRQVIDMANRLMRDFGAAELKQTAGQDGNLVDDRVIGGGSEAGSSSQWVVYGDRLAAGVLHGIEKGAIVSLFDDPSASDRHRKGYAEVASASPSESRISPIREFPCPFVNGNPRCRLGGSEIMDGARYARLVAPPRDYTITVSSPRSAAGAPEPLKMIAIEAYKAIINERDQDGVRERIRFDDVAPDLVWWVTQEGFRLLPSGIDPASLKTGAGLEIKGTAALDEVLSRTTRLLLRGYRVERLRRLAAEPDAAPPEVLLSIAARSNSSPGSECNAGAGAPVVDLHAVQRAQPCSVIGARITNPSAFPRYISVFSIDSDWNIKRRCTDDGDAGGTGTLYAANGSRNCLILRYGSARGKNDPNVPDLARYELLLLSTPRREGTQPPEFESIENLNTDKDSPGATSRSIASALAFDDDLTGEAFRRGGSTDYTPPTISIIGWEVDASGPK